MSCYYRREMRAQFDLLANRNPPMTVEDLRPIDKVKLLIHLWMVMDEKATRVEYDANGVMRNAVPQIPDTWCNGEPSSSYHYTVNGFTYVITVTEVAPSGFEVNVLDEESSTEDTSTTFNGEIPTDCSDENAHEDEFRIYEITSLLICCVDSFMKRVREPSTV